MCAAALHTLELPDHTVRFFLPVPGLGPCGLGFPFIIAGHTLHLLWHRAHHLQARSILVASKFSLHLDVYQHLLAIRADVEAAGGMLEWSPEWKYCLQ